MKRLVQIADKMRQHEERFLLVLDVERRARRIVLQLLNGRVDRLHDVVLERALQTQAIVVVVNADVGEVVLLVARLAGQLGLALVPVALGVIFHPSLFIRPLENNARRAEVVAVRVGADPLFHGDAADAVGPRPGLLQLEPKDFLNLLAGIRSGERLIGNRADLLVTHRAPR